MKRLSNSRWQLGAIILLFLVGLTYGQLIRGYFATDEWWAFSYAVSHPNLKELLAPEGVYAPGANLFISFLYRVFGLNAHVWAGLTLLLHTLNTLFVYWLGIRLTKRIDIAFVMAALFTILPMGSQFLHQFSLTPTSGMATCLAMLALLTYTYRRSVIAALLLLISLSFSPYAVPFIFLILLAEFILFDKREWRRSLLAYLPIVIAFASYLTMIHHPSLRVNQLRDRPVSGNVALATRVQAIGQKIYQSYGELWAQLPGTIDPKPMIRYSTVIVIVSLSLIAVLIWRKQYQLAKVAVVGLLWIPASVSLFSTLNTVVVDATFPSRYFYVTTIGAGLLAGSIIVGVLSFKLPITLAKLKNLKSIEAGSVALALLFLLLAFRYVPITRDIVHGEVVLGKTRKMIVDTITKSVPKPLRRDGLFCFTSNTGHYGQGPEMIPLPFVHNFAFTLAVTYRANDRPLRTFFTESGFFVNPAASFYYYSGDQKALDGIGPGIGFATNPEACKAVKERHKHLGLADIYGFAYDGNKPQLVNITPAMQEYVAGKPVEPKALYPWQSTKDH